MIQKTIFFALTLLMALSAVCQKKKVAVFDPTGLKDDAAIQIAREMIIDRLISSTAYIVLEREKINQVLKENAYQQGGHVDESQISDLGKQMGADFVCVSTVQSLREMFFFSTRLVDVITAQAYASGVGRSEDIFVAIEIAAQKLVGSSEDITIKLSATVEQTSNQRKDPSSATTEIVIKKESNSTNRNISVIAGGSASKSNLVNLALECKKNLATQYTVLDNYPDSFTVKSSLNSWATINNADYVINFGQNLGKKIVINIYNKATNSYEYIYTDISNESANAMQNLINKIVSYIEK